MMSVRFGVGVAIALTIGIGSLIWYGQSNKRSDSLSQASSSLQPGSRDASDPAALVEMQRTSDPHTGLAGSQIGSDEGHSDLARKASERGEISAQLVAKNQAYVDENSELSSQQLLDLWPGVIARADPSELPSFILAFAHRLRIDGDESVYATIAAAMRDPGISAAERSALVTLLGRTASAPAVEILCDLLVSQDWASNEVSAQLRDSLLEAAQFRIEGRTNSDIADVLIHAWREVSVTGQPMDQAVVADSLAIVGSAAAVATLMASLNDSATNAEERRAVVDRAIQQLRTNEAVPTLSASLASAPPDSVERRIAIDGLLSIQSADSYWALLKDLKRSDAWDADALSSLEGRLTPSELSDEALKVIQFGSSDASDLSLPVKELLASVLAAQTNLKLKIDRPGANRSL